MSFQTIIRVWNIQRGPINRRCARSIGTYGWIILFICIMTFILGSRGNSDVFLDAYTFLLYDDTST